MLRLAFQGEVPTRSGLMATFRAGEKWIKSWLEEDAKPFEVLLLDGGGTPQGEAIVIAVEYKQLSTVTDKELRLDCNMPGRAWESLYYELINCYQNCAKPERNQIIDPTSFVSVVWFILK